MINSSTSFFIPSDRKSNHSHSKTVGPSVSNRLIHRVGLSVIQPAVPSLIQPGSKLFTPTAFHFLCQSVTQSGSSLCFLPRMHIIHCSRSVSRIYLCPPSPSTVTADASILYLYDNGRPRLKALRTEQSDLQLPSRVLKVPALG